MEREALCRKSDASPGQKGRRYIYIYVYKREDANLRGMNYKDAKRRQDRNYVISLASCFRDEVMKLLIIDASFFPDRDGTIFASIYTE